MIKAVIFNVTGVICEPGPFIQEAREIVLKRHGVDYKPELHTEMLGLALRDQLKVINKKYGLSLEYDSFSKETQKIANEFELMEGKLKASPGVKELIHDLKENDIRIAIASQNLKSNISHYLKIIGISEEIFDVMVTVEDLIKFKPDPQIFEITCKKLGVKPKECVMIDDSVFGFGPAKKLGIKGIGICSTFQKKENLEKVADLVIDSLEELNYEKIKSLS
ncbi:MAG: HAD family hydrolase [Candidatus Nanoarchaeia archaeon]